MSEPTREEVCARLTGEFLRGCWSVPTDALNAFFRQAYAHGKRAGWDAGYAAGKADGMRAEPDGYVRNETINPYPVTP